MHYVHTTHLLIVQHMDLKDVQELLIGISHKWYDVGVQLNLESGVLKRIQRQYSNPADCLREMLEEWLKRVNPYPSWRALVQALTTHAVSERRLAEEINNKFVCKGKGRVLLRKYMHVNLNKVVLKSFLILSFQVHWRKD